jgi:hypothetical protein
VLHKDSLGNRWPWRAALRVKCLLRAIALCGLAGLHAEAVQAQAPDPNAAPAAAAPGAIAPGSVAISGFSGSTLSAESLAPGVDPTDKTIIDVEGASLKVFDLTTLGQRPAGQLLSAPVKFEVKAGDIGQVFPLAFDDGGASGGAPNLFAGSSSAFGIQIVGAQPDAEGKPVRLKAGAPGARFMDGQFGGLPGGSSGTIWKIDGSSGAVSVFADTGVGGVSNSGPGLGGLAIDAKTRSLFASDLDTGLILRFSLEGGPAPLGQFDHGETGRSAAGQPPVADDGARMDIASPSFKPDDLATWGFTQAERRVTGLAVNNGRLYYAVSGGPEIWSVGLTPEGDFGSDARLETAVRSQVPAKVTKIVFDGQGRMIVALRGAAKNPFDFGGFTDADSGDVLRFAPVQPGTAASSPAPLWTPEADSFAIGSSAGSRAGSGGVSLGHAYGPDGNIDSASCDATLLATSDALGAAASTPAQGLQLNSAELVRPANEPPSQSAFLDFDGQPGDPAAIGHIGDVAAFQRCDGQGAPPLVAEGAPGVEGGAAPPIEGSAPPIAGGGAPPVEGGGPPVEGAQTPANVAVTKTQNCRLVGADTAQCDYTVTAQDTGQTPFQGTAGVIEDTFSVTPDTLTPPEGAQQTGTGFQMPFTPIPAGGGAQPAPLSFSATFKVPQGGLVVENCAALTFPGAGGGAGVPQTPAGANVTIATGPTCQPNNDGTQDCVFEVLFENLGTERKNASFNFATVSPMDSISGSSGTGQTLIDNLNAVIEGPNIGPGETKLTTLTVTFPANTQDVSGTVALDETRAGPGGMDPQNPADPGGQAADPAGGADGDPADNTSCVRWDSNNPTDQGTPTNTPTEPQPDTAGNEPDGGGGEGADPDPNAPNLAIAKTQTCQMQGANQAQCSYVVTVTNPGQTPFQLGGGAVIDDVLDVPPTTMTSPQTADRTPTGFRLTQNTPLVIAPGESISDTFSATFAVPAGGLKVTNCAAMTLPPGGTPIPAVLTPIDDTADAAVPPTANGLDRAVSIAGQPVCISRGAVKDCAWTVTVANNGTVPFLFGFKLTTTPPHSAVSAANLNSRVDGNTTILESGAVLAPGVSRTLTVQATVPADAAPVSATVTPGDGVVQAGGGPDVNPANNSATAQAGTEASQESPPGEASADSNADDNRACVTFDSANPTEQNTPPPAQLTIVKTATPDTCAKDAAARNWSCAFKVTVTNGGAAPFNGQIVLTDETNFAAEATATGGWICSNDGGLGHRCENPAIAIPAGGSAEFTLTNKLAFDTVPVNTPPGGCVLDNTVSISSPPGAGGASTSTATAKLPLEENKGQAIPCDPPNLSLAKTSLGCAQAGSGFECRYRLTVTSVGPDPFEGGTIQIDEILPAGSAIKSKSSEWNCPGIGGTVRCTLENVRLPVGASRNLDLTIAVPQSAVARGQCEIRNEARIVQPGRDMSRAGQRLRASATAKVPSPECEPPALPPPPPPSSAVSCYGGMILVASGRCECPPGQQYNTARRSCVTPPPRVCPTGWGGVYPTCCQPGTYYQGGACLVRVAPPPPDCPRGWEGRYPTCCPPGSNYRRGRCERPEPEVCRGNRPVGIWPNCCPIGYTFERGACRPPRRQPDPPHDCAAHQRLGANGRCVNIGCPPDRPVGDPPYCCPLRTQYLNGACRPVVTDPGPCPLPGQYRDRRGQCVFGPCPQGQVRDRRGHCTIVGCPPDRPVGNPPYCCPPRTQYLNGACRPVVIGPGPCPLPGQYRDRRGQCVFGPCPQGQVRDRRGQCTIVGCPPDRPVGNPPYCCPRGTLYLNGACRPRIADPGPCPLPGQYRDRRGQCVFGPCPPGMIRDRRGQCVRETIGCPRDRPVGTPPYCCPTGTSYIRGACRSASDNSGPGPGGSCPPGYRRLPRPNRYGARCEQIPTPGPTETRRPCPPGFIGRWPYCRRVSGPTPTPGPADTRRPCPPGYIGRWPYCRRLGGGGGTPAQCGGGMIRRPDGGCACPPGMTGTNCAFPVVR